MLGSMLAALVIFGQAQATPGRYEIGERLKELDQTWSSSRDKARRSAAIPKITKGFQAYLESDYPQTCRSFDEAIAALGGRQATAEDAVTLRFDPPFVEPRTPANLRIGWAYLPSDNRNVRIQVGKQSVVAQPGRSITIEVRPEALNPEILQNPEVGYVMPVTVGPELRSVYLSIIKNPKARIASLSSTKQPEAKFLVEFLQKAFGDPDSLDSDLPLIQYLFSAELLDEGRMKVERADSIPLVRYHDTIFRAAFPRAVKGSLDLVIGLADSVGSENTFFDGFGRGSAVTESLRRGWAFVAPRTGQGNVRDIIEWIRTRRRQTVRRVFLIAHSSALDFALKGPAITPKLSGAAIFAPSVDAIPAELKGIPLFVAVGKQDSLAANQHSLGQQLSKVANSQYIEFDNCERHMVVSEGLPDAFRFFDQKASR